VENVRGHALMGVAGGAPDDLGCNVVSAWFGVAWSISVVWPKPRSAPTVLHLDHRLGWSVDASKDIARALIEQAGAEGKPYLARFARFASGIPAKKSQPN
jgi:hypothetical protein